MGVCEWIGGVLGDGFVEVVVFSFCDIAGISHPDGFDIVEILPLPNLFCDGFGLLLWLFDFSSILLTLVGDLGLIFFLFSRGLFSSCLHFWSDLVAVLVDFNGLSDILREIELDGVVDEL
jgi:hypothetical protein